MKHIELILTATMLLFPVIISAQENEPSVRAWEDKITMPTYLLDPA